MDEEKELKNLIIQGAVYKTTFTKKFEKRVNWEAPNSNLLYSFIPGTIIDIFVKPKDKVKEGETLLLLEAMKMQNQVRMPFDGEIVKIYVKKNDIIPKKHLMIEIAPKQLKK
ncbi:MAG: acetyl-CoA carboxylase biotin carboxyl carrier protein subunit [Bacteroidales bacterium]|jgi:biotin carboxyl carrier protein|nr:acetyl-CoA carboxylase biotin carboxyl carrier protein subunit [Bacteroidales bacterium]